MLIILLSVLTGLVTLYGLHFGLIAIIGLIKKDIPIPQSPPTHRIAALIPARNEQQVVSYLVDSLVKQRYPKDMYDIYVIVNNCTDDTERVAREAGARILRCEKPVTSKGEVMRFAFAELLLEDAPVQYDAFCIFDADNLADGGFIQAANDALSAGYMLAQGYRDSKNPSDNWVSGATSTFFWFMSRLHNNSRHNIGMSASLNGTGIMISSELVRQLGFNVTTLTEDLEYTAQAILGGYKIGWMKDAIVYDEQPTLLKDSFTQRRRWGAGSLQCSKKYLPRLLKMAVKQRNLDALDIGLLFMGMYVQAIGCLPGIITAIICLIGAITDPATGLKQLYWVASSSVFGSVCLGAAFVFIMAVLEKKLSKMGLSTYLLMCVYMLVWIPANLSSLITRPPKWESIKHVSSVGIDSCSQQVPVGAKPKRPLRHSKESSL